MKRPGIALPLIAVSASMAFAQSGSQSSPGSTGSNRTGSPTLWNQLHTGKYEGMLAETITIQGYNSDPVRAYYSRPLGEGPWPGIILIPHMPGWDEWNRETARRFTAHGYAVICPDIYGRFGQGLPTEVSAKAREAGGVADASVMGDCKGALGYLTAQPNSNGKVGVIGMCSGGRHSFLAACQVDGLSAAVDCWGGGVVGGNPSPAQPVAPIDLTADLKVPLMGIFGNDDRSPTPEQVNQHEAELKKHGKDYVFHRYDGAGHAFWSYDRDAYRPVAAMDSWNKVFEFFAKHLKE
jgi:carboxymethylenebutenolidase